jgi:glycosyltransferase involved in cell wall biosynthesis
LAAEDYESIVKRVAQPGLRVCLVTSGNVASNPRLVKEADALLSAGYSVRIVSADIIHSLSRFDHEIFGRLGVEFVRVSFARPIWRRVARGITQRLALKAAGFSSRLPLSLAAFAHHPLGRALTAAASNTEADLFIAHNLAALPAAATAALRYNARLGFDAEDYHVGELPESDGSAVELRIRRRIEGDLLRKCSHLTSASPDIGAAYEADYGVKMTPILNVFPISEAAHQPQESPSMRGESPSLYWFSQTVGPGRGLEEIVAAMGRLKARATLRLRGNISPKYAEELKGLASRTGGGDLAGRIEFLPVASPSEMVRLAAGHDVGLATELSVPLNRALCLTNKIFAYLLAGVPVLLSPTRAQSEFAKELGSAALVVDIGEPQKAAELLDAYLGDSGQQAKARAEAWRIGRQRYNWDIEMSRFLASVEAALI